MLYHFKVHSNFCPHFSRFQNIINHVENLLISKEIEIVLDSGIPMLPHVRIIHTALQILQVLLVIN